MGGTGPLPPAFGPALTRPGDAVVNSERALEEEYTILQKLGEGSFGLVQKAVRVSDGEIVAVKSIFLDRLKEYGKNNVENELEIARRLQHPNIALVHAVHIAESQMHLVMELCSGGDLLGLITKGTFFTEKKIALYLWQMVAGIAYCHHNRICHRDLKPENYLLESSGFNSSLKLIDFGLARVFERGKPMHSTVGTLQYCAPEMLGRHTYNEKCDVWAIGVVGFVLCTRRSPFQRKDERLVVQDIVHGNGDWSLLDSRLADKHPLKRLIQVMLTLEPEERPEAKSFIEDEWFRLQGTQPPKGRCCPGLFR